MNLLTQRIPGLSNWGFRQSRGHEVNYFSLGAKCEDFDLLPAKRRLPFGVGGQVQFIKNAYYKQSVDQATAMSSLQSAD
jgi:hypothetical protein